MWVTKLLISPVKKRIFCPKMTKFGLKLAFWSFLARPCWLIWCPVGGSVGGCGAGCISQYTYLLYDMIKVFRSMIDAERDYHMSLTLGFRYGEANTENDDIIKMFMTMIDAERATRLGS